MCLINQNISCRILIIKERNQKSGLNKILKKHKTKQRDKVSWIIRFKSSENRRCQIC